MSRASDIAYGKIKAYLLSGSAGPGSQLTEDHLASISGVSRTPVRDAVRRLETELLVVRSDSNRLFVADWSPSDLEEMFTLRAMMESHGAARAAARIKAEAIAELRAVNAALEDAISKDPPDILSFLAQNRRFHDIIVEAASSPRLANLLPMLVEQPIVYQTAQRYRIEDLAQSASDHSELIAAFEAHDASWAQAVMHSHIRRAFHAFSTAVLANYSKVAGDQKDAIA